MGFSGLKQSSRRRRKPKDAAAQVGLPREDASSRSFPALIFSWFPREHSLSYLSLRACIGLWTAFLCIVLVATNASSLVCYITRFTEEAFASLICMIFIYEALEKLSHLRETYPVHMHSKLDFLTIY